MGYLCCPPHHLLHPPRLLPPFKDATGLLFFPLLFGLLYLQNSSLSKALFPHLLSKDAIQSNTNLSPCPLLFLGWLDLLLESTCTDKFNQQEFLKSHIFLCSFRRNMALEALLKNTFGSREEVTGRTENPVKLKPSLLLCCRGVTARGGIKTVCSCTRALVQETSPTTRQPQAGVLYRRAYNEKRHKHVKGWNVQQQSQHPTAGLPSCRPAGILPHAQCQQILHVLIPLHRPCLCLKQLSAPGSEGSLLRWENRSDNSALTQGDTSSKPWCASSWLQVSWKARKLQWKLRNTSDVCLFRLYLGKPQVSGTRSQCRRGIRSSHLRSLHWEQQSLLLMGTQSYIFISRFSSLFLCSEGPQVNLQYYYLIIKQKTSPNHFVFGNTFSFSVQIFTSMYHRIGNNDFKYATPKCYKY